jgi:hypothetical protein
MGTDSIGTLKEKPLHAALKRWYARPGDLIEAPVDGCIIDIVRGRQLIEIQTGSFAKIKGKLTRLVQTHPVRLVCPVASDKWIVKLAQDGCGILSRRKSPKHGSYEHVFHSLVSFPGLPSDPNLSVEVLLIQEDELRRYEEGLAWRRRGWVTQERRLIEVRDRRLFRTAADFAALLPANLPTPFTTADLASAMARPRRLAQRMAYCLREMGVLEPTGKRGNNLLYLRAEQ